MKKLIVILGAVLFSSLSLSSCKGGGIESDSEMVADYMCKLIKLSEKKQAGDLSVEVEMKKLETEADSILKELKIKYSSSIDQLKFQEAVKNEMLKCE